MTQVQPASIEGIYEVCVGVRDPIPLIQYWEQFGYRIGQVGELPAESVNQLYGVNSSLRSIRLYHQDADHGLVRLMVWENPLNDGLGMGSMRVRGNRWATALTADVLNILNHAEEASAAGKPVKFTDAVWEVIYNKERRSRPFVEPTVGVREMMMLQPLTRQVFFQRFNYTVPDYGKINQSSFFKTSQITHAGMVIQESASEALRFYDEILGLLRVRDDRELPSQSSIAARQIFDIQASDLYWVTTFDDPRSSKSDWQAARSGRLYIMRLPDSIQLENKCEEARPGCLGMSLYTYRVRDLEDYLNRVRSSQATQVTEILSNEFAERSFSFVAPDEYFWTLIEK